MCAFALVLLASFVIAANSTNVTNKTISNVNVNTVVLDNGDGADKGYVCLENLIKNKTSLSLQDAIFTTLALGSRENVIKVIEDQKKANENCWPKSGCTLKETSQVLLAYQKIGKDTSGIENWIMAKNSTPSELDWYLEIDVTDHIPTQCKVTYDGTARTVNVLSDMRLDGSLGSCLSVSSSGYWLKIKESCIDKQFDVLCNENFLTTLLYQRKSGGTVYVSSETHSAVSLGTTSEKINARCFKSSTSCDYEGSLWATFALDSKNKDVSKFTPYLIALSQDNTKYFPSAFIYKLTETGDSFDNVAQLQKQGKFWEMIATPYGRYYDTSIGLLGFQGTEFQEAKNAKDYLLSIQSKEGCWNNNNIRDTAFILASGWPRAGSGGGSGGGSTELCTSASYTCSAPYACTSAGGFVKQEYICGGQLICCTVNPAMQKCAEKGGIVCTPSQSCSISVITSLEGGCCTGTCNDIQSEYTCEETNKGSCRAACSTTNEVEIDETCSGAQVCCQRVENPPSSTNWWIWILIFLILIVIIVILILFKDKIRLWWFKRKGGASVTSVSRPSPPGNGLTAARRPIQYQQRPAPAVRRPVTQKDWEFEDTLKKLRDMSK